MNFFDKFRVAIMFPNKYWKLYYTSLKGAFGYLLIISLTIGLLGSLPLFVGVFETVRYMEYVIEKKVPDFKIANGLLEISQKEEVIYSSAKKFLMIININKDFTRDDIQGFENGVLVNDDSVIIKINNKIDEFKFNNIKKIEFIKLGNINFTKNTLLKYTKILKILIIIMIPFSLFAYFVTKVIGALFISFIGMIIISYRKYNIEYKKIYILSVYSLTLPIAIEAFLSAASIVNGLFFIIYNTISIMFLNTALNEIVKVDKR